MQSAQNQQLSFLPVVLAIVGNPLLENVGDSATRAGSYQAHWNAAEDEVRVVHPCNELVEVGQLLMLSVVWLLATFVVHGCW